MGVHWCAWNDLCIAKEKGDRISVWNYHWIPGVDIDRSNDNTNNTEIELILDLIEAITRKWKADLIENTFLKNIAQKILQIPLAKEENDDFQVWQGEHFGEFTARSAYKLLQEATVDPSVFLID
ncbi:hypothetical protein V6Z12_A10G154500 [Gossypium hirsutum]